MHKWFPTFLVIVLFCVSLPAVADYKDDIGYTQLESEQGINTPDGSGISVTQAEAATSFVGNDPVYLPDLDSSQFSDTNITAKSGLAAGTFSGHANGVGTIFYGDISSIAPGVSFVDAFWADHWLQSGFLSWPGTKKPLVSSSRIANHS
ncbi:MAG: hypothetical protein KAJ65_07875, partial [Gammaproteobacteria bacterium]|nr:hypothetical protein [Gammaproteobacteria bacterium]